MFKLKETVESIEVVLKIAERCNINCSYCYMFNKQNEEYQDLPAYIKQDTVERLAEFLVQGVHDLKAKTVHIGLHGGEPMMIKKKRYVEICETFQKALGSIAKLSFSMQTNAILIDAEWVAIFERFNIDVGVSIDGPREYNDIARLDHKGRSTYDAVMQGLKVLGEHRKDRRSPGILTVINPEADGAAIYRHLVDDVGSRSFDFLFPIETWDSFDFASLPKYSNYLRSAFDEWVKDNNPNIKIRLFSNIIRYFSGGAEYVAYRNDNLFNQWALVTVDSNGGIGPDDSLKPLNGGLFAHNIYNITLKEFLNAPLMRDLAQAEESLPASCHDCIWQVYCKGSGNYGRFANRFSQTKGFDNPTLFCAPLKELYAHIANHLLRAGLPYARLVASLDHANYPKIPPPQAIRQASLGTEQRKTIPIYVA